MRVGIAGLGKMGQNHLRELQKDDEFSVVALYDLKKNAEFNEPFFTDLAEFLKANLDIIIISSPTSSHLALAKALLPRVKTALIEKPLAMNLQEMREIADLAKTHENAVAVGFSERFNPAILALKKALENEKIISINARRYSPLPVRIGDVGILQDLSIHDIDLVGFLSGAKFYNQGLSSIKKDGREIEAMIRLESVNFTCESSVNSGSNALKGVENSKNSSSAEFCGEKNLANSGSTEFCGAKSKENSAKIIASLHQSWNCTQKLRQISVITEKSFFEADLNAFKLYKDGVCVDLYGTSPLFSEHKELLRLAKSGDFGLLADINAAINAQKCLELA